MFGSANVAYQIAKNGNLVEAFDRKLWGKDGEGLFITAGLVVVFIMLFPLQSVAMMGSAAFLVVYAVINLGHYRIRKTTGARGWIILTSVVLCLALFAVLSVYIVEHQPTAYVALIVTLAVSLAFEASYRKLRGRTFAQLVHHLESLGGD